MGYAVFVAALLGALMLIPASGAACAAAADSLKLFAEVIAPSLFPFLVLAGVMIRSGVLTELRPKRRLPAAAAVQLLAAVCGTPSASLMCRELASAGVFSRRRASALCAAANQAGPVFVAVSLASGLAGSSKLALPFMLPHYLPALICAALIGAIPDSPSPAPVPAHAKAPLRGVFTGAVSDAVSAAARICGMLVFFRVAYAALCGIGLLEPLSPLAKSVLCGAFEMTGGLALLAQIGGERALALCAAVLSWGGVCVFSQSKLAFPELEAAPYFAVKAVHAAASCLLFPLFCGVLGAAEPASFSLDEALPHAAERGAVLMGLVFSLGGSLLTSALLCAAAVKKGSRVKRGPERV